LDHPGPQEKPYHHGDLRRVILDAAERRLTENGVDAVTIRACARDAGVSPAAPIHHFGSLKGLLSALAARGFEQLVARLNADLETRAGSGPSLLVGAYVAFAVSSPRMFDLMWREDVLDPDGGDLSRARRVALERLQAHVKPTDASGDDRIHAIRAWSLAHGLATLLQHGRIQKAFGAPGSARSTTQDFAKLAYDEGFSSL
jgi:AcrR family transcriptional regulator